MTRILVVDDDLAIREMVAMALEKSGYQVTRAEGYAAGLGSLRERRPDLVVSDIYMPGGTGLDLLRAAREQADPPPLILMTAKGTIETAALAMQDGVFDYLAKPFELDLLLERVRAALASRAATTPEAASGPESMIVGAHAAIVEVYKATGRVAPLRVPVLVLGETGTGKELVARALHRFGGHPEGPFVPIHCGALPDSLIESELFGHRQGAFTDARQDRRGALAQADGGTAFLDEIGEISPVFQVKLLRFLEDGLVLPLGAERPETVAVRVVAATHRDLRAMVAEGRFREDLYYRLAGYEITLPPLSQRLSDLPALAAHFQRRFQEELGLPANGGLPDASLAILEAHPWPGNVRELGHIIRRALIEAGSLEDPATLRRLLGGAPAPAPRPAASFQPPFAPLEELERNYLLAVLGHTAGNKTEAARILGIERKTLARKLRQPEGEEPEENAP
jgi:DNA-binding NtrC family response regulator